MKFLTLDGLARVLRPLKLRLSNLVSRGVVRRVDDAPGIQELQAELLADEVRDELEHLQHFGFASHADDGAECVVIFPGGDRSAGFVVATGDRRYRVKVEKGETALYDMAGSKVLLKQNGDIELTPFSGVVRVHGDVNADGVSLKTHKHGSGTLAAPPGGGAVTGISGEPT